jgi:hypothetical protein
MFDALSPTDIISLVLLILIAVIVLRQALAGGRSYAPTAGRGSSLSGGAGLEPDLWLQAEPPTDTNDPVLLSRHPGSHYVGPEQAALALAMLDDAQSFAEVGGHVPADLSLFLDQSFPSDHLGSNDPAALASLVLLDPTARFAEEVSDEPPHPALAALRGLALASVLLALLYRLIFF